MTGADYKVRIAAENGYTGAFNEFKQQMSSMDGAARSLSGRFSSQFTNNVRNVSYQIQDFATQVGGGTSAMRALSQQLPQMLIGFGAFGAVAGTVVAFLPTLIQLFSDTGDAAKTLSSANSDVSNAMGEVGKAARTFNLNPLYEEYNKASVAARQATIEQLKFQQTFLRTAQLVAERKFGESIGGLGDASTLQRLSGAFGADALAEQLGIARNAASELLPVLKGLQDGSEDVGLAFTKFGNVLLGGNERAVKLALSLKEMSGQQKDAQAASSALSEALQKMGNGTAAVEVSTGKAGRAAKEVSGYWDEMVRIGKELNDELKASERFWAEIERAQEQAADAAGKYATAQAAAREQDALAREANIRSVIEQVNAIELEVEQLGMSNEERQRSTLLLALEKSGLDVDSEAYRELAKRINDATQAKIDFAANQDAMRANAAAAKATADEWQRAADSIRDSLTDALLRGFESGKDFAKNLRDTLVNMFKTLVLRPIIQGVLAPVSNGLGGLFGGFGGSPAGNILGGGLGGLFSGFEGLPGFVGPLQPGTFGAGLSSFFQGASSPLSTFGTLFGGGGLAAIGGIGGLLGAALPIVGIGAALASAFGLFDRGGPKTGGSASSVADILGGTTGLGTLERLFTPNQRDSDVQKVTDSIATSFLSVARSLGIAGGTAQFGLGFDTDPEGDAGNRVSALATLNGQTVYQVTDRDLGREGDVTAALEEEAKRALFAALQASDMPAYLANLFDGIDAAGATAEQIDGILQTAAALKIAVDAISGLGDQFAALDPADVQGFVEAFGGLEGLLQRVAYIGENFYTDAERLAQATTRLEESFDALGIAVPQTHQAFLALLNGLDLTTAEGREMYEAISALAPLFVEVRGTAQEAADALEDAAGALDDVAQAASNIIDLGSLSGTVYGEANSAIARIIDLAGTLGGSIGEQLTAQINLANGEIQRYIALWQQAQPGSAESQALLEIIGILQQFNQGTAAALAQYTSIVAQYGSEYADAIYQLQQQYWQQTQLFQGNTQALSELAQWYNEQLQIILAGTEDGVTGTISELDRLRESLQDYLAGLSLRSDLSPLSPAARLAEAQRQYQDLLARAQTGDVDALRDLQGAADAYLRIAREMFASGADYTNIFQSVVDALSMLSEPPTTGGPEPRPEALLAAALPTNSRLASQDDIEWLAAAVIAAIRDGSREQAEATARGSERVAIASRPLR